MSRLLLRTKARLRDATKPLAEAAVGALTIGLLRTTRYFDPVKTANLFGRVTRFIGRRLREHRIGRANLKAAFPGKIAGRDRDHPGRRLGQSRPHRRRIRPSRPHLGLRRRIIPRKPAASKFGRGPMNCSTKLRDRRQAGADLRQPSRQLGTAGAGRGRPWAGRRHPVPPAEHRFRRPRHRRECARSRWER